MVVWLVGLSGSGKSSIAGVLAELWRDRDPRVVLLDGDALREAVDGPHGTLAFTREARTAREERIAALCAALERDGHTVICAVNSIDQRIRDANRVRFDTFFEVFVSTPLDVCLVRDREDLYLEALRGNVQDVVGLDLAYEAPRSPDMIVDNGHPAAEPALLARRILNAAARKRRPHHAAPAPARQEAVA